MFVDNIEIPFEIKPVEFSIDEKGKFNRAKEKRTTRRLINDYYKEEK